MELIHVSGNTDCLLGKQLSASTASMTPAASCLTMVTQRNMTSWLVFERRRADPGGADRFPRAHRPSWKQQTPARSLSNSTGYVAWRAGLIASQAALERYTNYFGRSEEEKVSIDTEQRCPVDCIIQPEDTSVTLCGVTFPVHHLPGHSLDHIVIGTPDGVCFAGDALLTENVLRHVKLPYCDHVGLDLESKEAITKLPYQHWILSHKGPFDGNIRELADKNMDLVRLRLAELAKLLQRPMTRDEFYQESRRLIGMHIGTYDQLIRQERHLRPYLEQLVIDGTARLEVKNDTIYFYLNE